MCMKTNMAFWAQLQHENGKGLACSLPSHTVTTMATQYVTLNGGLPRYENCKDGLCEQLLAGSELPTLRTAHRKMVMLEPILVMSKYPLEMMEWKFYTHTVLEWMCTEKPLLLAYSRQV